MEVPGPYFVLQQLSERFGLFSSLSQKLLLLYCPQQYYQYIASPWQMVQISATWVRHTDFIWICGWLCPAHVIINPLWYSWFPQVPDMSPHSSPPAWVTLHLSWRIPFLHTWPSCLYRLKTCVIFSIALSMLSSLEGYPNCLASLSPNSRLLAPLEQPGDNVHTWTAAETSSHIPQIPQGLSGYLLFCLFFHPVFVMALLHPLSLNELPLVLISSCVQAQLTMAQAHPLAQLHHPLLGSE